MLIPRIGAVSACATDATTRTARSMNSVRGITTDSMLSHSRRTRTRSRRGDRNRTARTDPLEARHAPPGLAVPGTHRRPDARRRLAGAPDRAPAAAPRADRGFRAPADRRAAVRGLDRLRDRRAPGNGRAAPLDREPAGGAPRRRLRDPRPPRAQGRRA